MSGHGPGGHLYPQRPLNELLTRGCVALAVKMGSVRASWDTSWFEGACAPMGLLEPRQCFPDRLLPRAGGSLSVDDDAAKEAYGIAASRHAILSGGVEPPPALEPLYARLSQMAEGATTAAPSRGNASLERMTAGETGWGCGNWALLPTSALHPHDEARKPAERLHDARPLRRSRLRP